MWRNLVPSSASNYVVYLSARNLVFKVMFVVSIIIGGFVLYQSSVLTQDWLYDEIYPRLNPTSSPISVTVDLNAASIEALHEIRKEPSTVFVYQTSPNLELIGVGKTLIESEDDTYLIVSIFPKYSSRVLRQDSTAELLFESPSMMFMMRDLFFSERGQKLIADLKGFHRAVLKDLNILGPTLKSSLARHLKPEELTRIAVDPLIIQLIKQSLVSSVRDHIELNTIGSKLSHLPEIKTFIDLTAQDLDFKQARKEALNGLLSSSKQELKRSGQTLKDLWEEDELLSDGAQCLFNGLRKYHWGARLLDKLFLEQNSKLCTAFDESTHQILIGGLRAGGEDLARQTWKSTLEHSERSIEIGKAAIQSASRELKLKPIASQIWTKLSHNQVLFNHVRTRYGAETWGRLKAGIVEFLEHTDVSAVINKLSLSGESIIKRLTNALLLNHDESAPNPLIVTLIKEEVSGMRRAVVWITPGKSAAQVASGHRIPLPKRAAILPYLWGGGER